MMFLQLLGLTLSQLEDKIETNYIPLCARHFTEQCVCAYVCIHIFRSIHFISFQCIQPYGVVTIITQFYRQGK